MSPGWRQVQASVNLLFHWPSGFPWIPGEASGLSGMLRWRMEGDLGETHAGSIWLCSEHVRSEEK